jgi:uncharacterized ion transporter superfamily protein YfcC
VPKFSLPHPIVLLVWGIAIAAALTWIVPSGEYQRQVDEVTGRTVAVAGTYAAVEATPVTAFDVAVAIPRGFVEGADVIGTILFVGAVFFLLDMVGTLGRLLGALVRRLKHRGLLAIPLLVFFFGAMGAAENMQEEIIALVPVLLLLGRRIGVDTVTMVAVSAGAAVVGSAFGPTNPFQAGIALTLAELPVMEGGGLRAIMWLVGLTVWSLWVLRHAKRNRSEPEAVTDQSNDPVTTRDVVNMALVMVPLGLYVYGAIQWDWGFNELSGAFLVGAAGIGISAKLGATGTTEALLEGAKAMLPASLLVGLARSISLVLGDGKIIDTILHSLATPLSSVSPTVSALAMVPVQAALHIPVSSVSGQAALTMPIMIPLADLIDLSRQVTVLAYQTGAGLMDLITPTNGALLAVLLAAKLPYQKWLRFAIGGYLLTTLVGIGGILVALATGL